MNTKDLNRLVSEAFENQRTRNRDMFLREHTSLSRVYPDGIAKYCDLEIYTRINDIKLNTLIGHFWVLNGTWDIDSNEGLEWLTRIAIIEHKKITKPNRNYPADHPKKEINEFLDFFFELKELQKIKSDYIEEQNNGSTPGHLKPVMGGLYISELNQPIVALICYYRQKDITKLNYLNIANEFGITASIRLFNNYSDFTNKDKRVNKASGSVKIKNRIEKIKIAISHLSDSAALTRANNDLKELELYQ